jgi:hypothetical protein
VGPARAAFRFAVACPARDRFDFGGVVGEDRARFFHPMLWNTLWIFNPYLVVRL